MKAKRKLKSSEVKRARMAARDGYATYRYGSVKPVTLPRVFKGEAKEVKVSAVMELLQDWRLSPFEHEGEARAGIRSGLCLAGYKGKTISWSQADFEAECLVGEALKLMGAKRPTLLEGQRQYTVERENCQWCHGPLDKDDRVGHRQFCSNECSSHARNHNLPFFQRITSIRQSMAAYVAAKELQPKQECQWCQKLFKPASLLHKVKTVTCSPECNRAYVGSLKGSKKCLHCKEAFTPRWVNDKYCCVECQTTHRNERRRTESAERRLPTACEQCGEQFVPKKAGTRFCGEPCALRSRQERAKERNERPCIECGTVFRPARPSARSCSPRCVNAVRAREMAEEKAQASAFSCEDVTGFREAAE